VISYFGLSDQVYLDHVAFSWSYEQNLSNKVYRPTNVFKNFSFVHLFDCNLGCICFYAKRTLPFLDPLTHEEVSDMCKASVHV
jgi:hypothetical protein